MSQKFIQTDRVWRSVCFYLRMAYPPLSSNFLSVLTGTSYSCDTEHLTYQNRVNSCSFTNNNRQRHFFYVAPFYWLKKGGLQLLYIELPWLKVKYQLLIVYYVGTIHLIFFRELFLVIPKKLFLNLETFEPQYGPTLSQQEPCNTVGSLKINDRQCRSNYLQISNHPSFF